MQKRADEVLPDEIVLGLQLPGQPHAIWVDSVSHDIVHRTVRWVSQDASLEVVIDPEVIVQAVTADL